MNNGKVRIYELSKELNLDNKELLAICDQLNIAVKSHSSTITESDAQRIRSAAQKLSTTQVQKKDGIGNQKHNSMHTGSRSRPNAPKKQEILEIRKPKIDKARTGNSSQNLSANNQAASSEANPPSPPRSFAPSDPSSQKVDSQSVDINREVTQNQPEKEQAPAVVENKTKNKVNNQSQGSKTNLGERSDKATQSRKQEKAQKPQLVAPPSRPVSSKGTSGVIGTSVEKPILKRDKEQAKSKNNKPPSGLPKAGQQKSSKPAAPSKPEEKVARANVASPAPPQRPSKPTRPEMPVAAATPPKQIATTLEKGEEEQEDPIAATIELRRPTPPRQPRGGKKRHVEEEIEENKPSKVAKNKRQKPIIDDFEDDDDLLEDGSSGGATATQVSNAIARPPRPKSGKPSQPATKSAPTVRSKRSSSSRESNRRRGETETKRQRPEIISVVGSMTVQELANELAIADTEIVKILFLQGMAVSITHNLDIPTITLVANEVEVEVITEEPEAEARKVTKMLDEGDFDNLQRRPPVVTIMGHVDHGKTTLLDSIRKSKVASGEAGGITQHIGAYHVDIEHNGKEEQIVFLDTPGHEAFTAMRARGARVTDIAILVVAADDGVRPQTIEAISHAKAAKVPILVAINKIDKEGAQPDRVKQELTQHGLTSEEWGGETIMVPVSAINGENLDTLLEMILLVSEVEELNANPNREAKGTVIEAHLDKAKGAVATLLIQNGSLRVGDTLVAGSVFGKVRAMVDDRGNRVEVADPSFAVEVLGLSDVPAAGDEFDVFYNEKEARALAIERADKQRQSRLMQGRVTLTSISSQAQEGELKELNLILKADVQGSVEAIIGSLQQIPQNEVQLRMLLASAGEITETDIDLAAASGAVIIGFNTTYASGARQAADEAGVDVREYNIIYKLLEDIEGALEGLLEPELVEEPLGQAEVRAVFKVGRGEVAGCYIQSGKLLRNCQVRLHRKNQLVHEGVLDSLKRMRDDVREVNSGYECGVGIDKFNNWQEGDIIEAFQMVTKRRTLSAAAAR
ncbi:MAG: translation initiation factor IF-2 [Mastigocoleus sp.]